MFLSCPGVKLQTAPSRKAQFARPKTPSDAPSSRGHPPAPELPVLGAIVTE